MSNEIMKVENNTIVSFGYITGGHIMLVNRINENDVQQTDMQRYGNEMRHKATDNRDKSFVTIQAADFARLQEQLDRSGINYYAYDRDNSVIMAINDKDIEWFKRIAGTPDLVPTKEER